MQPSQVIAQDLGDKRVEALLHPAEGGGPASSHQLFWKDSNHIYHADVGKPAPIQGPPAFDLSEWLSLDLLTPFPFRIRQAFGCFRHDCNWFVCTPISFCLEGSILEVMAKGFGSGAKLLEYWNWEIGGISHLLCDTGNALNCGFLGAYFSDSYMEFINYKHGRLCHYFCFPIVRWADLPLGCDRKPRSRMVQSARRGEGLTKGCIRGSSFSMFPLGISQASHSTREPDYTGLSIPQGAEQQLAHSDQDLSWSKSDKLQSGGSRRAIRRTKRSKQWNSASFTALILLWSHMIYYEMIPYYYDSWQAESCRINTFCVLLITLSFIAFPSFVCWMMAIAVNPAQRHFFIGFFDPFASRHSWTEVQTSADHLPQQVQSAICEFCPASTSKGLAAGTPYDGLL